MVFLIVIEILH